MPPSESKWELSEHTLGKHQILQNYLAGWLPILGFNFNRLVYIDGFAGPGEYQNGELGSPLIALNQIEDYLEQSHSDDVEVVCLFVEADKTRADYLRAQLKGRVRDGLNLNVENDTFEKGVTQLLDGLDDSSSQLAPSFTVIDPFGIKGVRMETIGRLLKQPKSECMITFMDESISRFRSTPEFRPHLRELFGTENWANADVDLLHPSQALREKFIARLKEEGAAYVLPFKVWRGNRHVYTIFFATQSLKGCDLMKSCMWKVDKSGGYSFRSVDSNSSNLFQQSGVNIVMEPFLVDLINEFGTNTWVHIEAIDRFARGDKTIYYSGQLRQKTLQPAERAGRIRVFRPEGVRGFTANKGVKVQFLK